MQTRLDLRLSEPGKYMNSVLEKKGGKELYLYWHLLSPYEKMLSDVISTHRLQQTHQRESDIITSDNLQAPCTRAILR